MATFIKQPCGAVLVRIRIKGFPPVSRQFNTKQDARDWAAVVEGEMRCGLWRDPTTAHNVTLRHLADDYIREVVPLRQSKHCIKDETLRLKKIVKVLGDFSLAALNPQAVCNYRDTRLKVVKPASVNRELAILSALLTWARREKGIPLSMNVASGTLVRRPRASNGRTRRLSGAEEGRIITELARCKNELVLPAFRLLLSTGMRCSEMLSIRWQDVDFKNHAIYVHQTKNGDSRAVPLTRSGEAILLELNKQDEQQYVFPTLTYECLKQAFVRARKRAGLIDFRLHDLRHEATSRAAETGTLTIAELQAVTGHRDIRMVSRYAHILPTSVARKLRDAGM